MGYDQFRKTWNIITGLKEQPITEILKDCDIVIEAIKSSTREHSHNVRIGDIEKILNVMLTGIL